MKRSTAAVLTGMCVLILSLSLNCLAEDLEKKQRELRTQITLYNLVNGLYLTNNQMEFILSRAKDLDSLRERLEERKRIFSSPSGQDPRIRLNGALPPGFFCLILLFAFFSLTLAPISFLLGPTRR